MSRMGRWTDRPWLPPAPDGASTVRPAEAWFPAGERRWLALLAATTVAEWLWWAVAWARGLAPLPMLLPYLLLTAAIGGAALLLRRECGLPPINTSRRTFAAAVLLIGAGASAFLPIKYAIPKLVPFWLDPALGNFERRLLGADPWAILDRPFGWATMPLDWLYGGWLPTQSLILFLVIAARPSAAKTQALIAYALCWFLLGVVAATLLSSAGPIFFDRIFGGSDFAALAPTVRGRGAWVVFAESNPMWAALHSGQPGIAAGISAMPSIHVAISLWIALAARRLASKAAVPAFAYFVLMWIASVQLGWHYVLDGLAGGAGMLLLWVAAGQIAGGQEALQHAS